MLNQMDGRLINKETPKARPQPSAASLASIRSMYIEMLEQDLYILDGISKFAIVLAVLVQDFGELVLHSDGNASGAYCQPCFIWC